MSPEILSAIIGAAVVLALAGGGWLITWGRLSQRVSDLEEARREDRRAAEKDLRELKEQLDAQITGLRGRVDKAEAAALRVEGLAQAVDNMGKNVAKEVGHLAEVVGLRMETLRVEFEGLKGEVRARRRAPQQQQRKGGQGR